jgi:hypothetical protein
VTQRVACNGHIWCPIEGIRYSQASYLSLEWEVSVVPLRVGWHLAVRIFCMDYPGKTHETT